MPYNLKKFQIYHFGDVIGNYVTKITNTMVTISANDTL